MTIPFPATRHSMSVVESPTTLPPPVVYGSQHSGSKIISVQEAVYTVAIAEEEDAAEDVKEREEEEAEQLQQPKSWLTSWMFSKAT